MVEASQKTIQSIAAFCLKFYSVRNKTSPSDNDRLKLPQSDWFENLSDKLLDTSLLNIVGSICQNCRQQRIKIMFSGGQLWFDLADFKTSQTECLDIKNYFEHCFCKTSIFCDSVSGSALSKKLKEEIDKELDMEIEETCVKVNNSSLNFTNPYLLAHAYIFVHYASISGFDPYPFIRLRLMRETAKLTRPDQIQLTWIAHIFKTYL